MIDVGWLSDELVRVLRWHLAHPGGEDDPRQPEVPWAGMRAWSIFLALNKGRGAGMSGPAPLASAEIEAYARLRREPLRPFELDMLTALDAAWMEAAREADRAAAPAERPAPESILAAFRMAAGPNR